MRVLLFILLGALAHVSYSQGQYLKFKPYTNETEVLILQTQLGDLCCYFDFGFVEGDSDFIRMSVETSNDLDTNDNSHVISEIGFDSYVSPLVKKQKTENGVELFFKVSEAFIDAWRDNQIMMISGLQPLHIFASEVYLTNNDIWKCPAPWNLEGNGLLNQMTYLEYLQTIWNNISNEYFEGVFFEKYTFKLPELEPIPKGCKGTGIDNKFCELHSGIYDKLEGMELFFTDFKEYGHGLVLCINLPEEFSIDASARFQLTIRTEDGEKDTMLLPIMTNSTGAAIFSCERREAYRFGYIENGDTISSVYTSYFTSRSDFQEKYNNAKAYGEMFDSQHPDKAYWKDRISDISAYKDSIETNYFYLYHEDDMFDSCFMHNEVTMYLDVSEREFEVLKDASRIVHWELYTDAGKRIVYDEVKNNARSM